VYTYIIKSVVGTYINKYNKLYNQDSELYVVKNNEMFAHVCTKKAQI